MGCCRRQGTDMSASAFVVNGRYLTQSITGVQRYARNVVDAIDRLEEASGSVVLTPRSASQPGYHRLRTVETGFLQGYAWEQAELPLASLGRRLLNLCNMAPAIKNEQIVCIHDSNVLSSPESYSCGFRAAYRSLQPLLVRRAARIATVSHASARQLARYLPIALSEIAVLPNGHEHALLWNPAKAKLPAGLPVEEGDRPYVLAFGSRAKHKNMSLLVAIAPRLDEMGINIVIAGGGAIGATGASFEHSNVYHCGRVTDDDLAHLLDHALCLVFPSVTEGFGLPIVEAMARGCPVLSSDAASMPEVCGEAALMASPFDQRQWVDNIRSLAESEALRVHLIGAGREQCRHFSWMSSAEGYLELLENPVSGVRRSAAPKRTQSRVAAVFATLGRPDVVSATVRHFLATQTLAPSSVIVSCSKLEDAGDLVSLDAVKVVLSPVGLPAQRNTALKAIEAGTEIVAFFDDDFVADAEWLSRAAQILQDDRGIVGVTGHVVADGIKGPGIPFEEAVQIVEAATGEPKSGWAERYSPYGCNMAFRFGAIGDVRFDERLVLYGWLEDRDFGAQLAARGGRLVKSPDCLGVHMGVKSGRTSGERFGYSQIANPIYMMRKGTMEPRLVVGQIFRNLASNFGRGFLPEPYIDRRGRIRGNMHALLDLLRGQLAPERVTSFDAGRAIEPMGGRPADA